MKTNHSLCCLSLYCLLLYVLGLLSVNDNLLAAEQNGLYEARVAIVHSADANDNGTQTGSLKNDNDRELIRKAFARVLIKVSGHRTFLMDSEKSTILDAASDLVQKISYENETRQSADLTAADTDNSGDENASNKEKNGSEGQQNTEAVHKNTQTTEANPNSVAAARYLSVKFDPQGVDQLLRKYQLPVWGKLRPDTLIWFALEENGKRRIVAADHLLVEKMREVAASRGVSLLFPLVDAIDQKKLSLTDLWGDYRQVIQSASLRYHVPAIMSLRVYPQGGQWHARQTLYVLDKEYRWQSKDQNLSQLLQTSTHRLIDYLARLYAPASTQQENMSSIVRINNVTDFDSYLYLENYFSQVAAIKHYQLLSIRSDNLIYRLDYLGAKDYLYQSLTLGEVLQKVQNTRAMDTGEDNAKNTEDRDYVAVILADEKKSTPVSESPANSHFQDADTTTVVESRPDIAVDAEFWLSR